MSLILKPDREADSHVTFIGWWCKCWWEERVIMPNNGVLYKFDSNFTFFFEYAGGLHRTNVSEKNLIEIKKAYASWLLEKELR